MARLPVETWRHIVMKHVDARDCLALSITSSFLCSISQEKLYRAVSLHKNDDGFHVNRPFELFARSLKERPGLGALVHHLTVWHSARNTLSNSYYHPILSHLASFTRLCYLNVSYFHIDAKFLSALQSHRRLTEIKLSHCSIAVGLSRADTLLEWSGTSISTVIIEYPTRAPTSDSTQWAAVYPAGIRSLEFTHPSVPFVRQVFSNLILLGITTTLTKLSFGSLPLPANVISILISSPLLRCLYTRSPPYGQGIRSPFELLPSDAIPLLEDFTGPAEFVNEIVRGRPVNTVTLTFDHSTPVDVLVDLQRSAVPVLTLYLGCNEDDMPHDPRTYLMHSPRSLTCFGWDRYAIYSRNDVLSCALALSRFPHLAIIRDHMLDTLVFEPFRQRSDVVREYTAACPSIQEFDFVHERWLRRADGSWERYLDS